VIFEIRTMEEQSKCHCILGVRLW